MKRLSSSDSLGGLMSICPDAADENNHLYSSEFQTMLEEDCCPEESGRGYEKKRRLSVDQVKALEKYFEVENKLEPERKLKLAQEIGLQPRQVAVWFQNRRARWKTKQLERDYGALKANYDGLKLNFERLQRDNESLLKEIHELKSKLDENGNLEENTKLNIGDEAAETENENSNGEKEGEVWPKFVDGSSDSDTSAILNDENNGSLREALNGSSSSNLSTNMSLSFLAGGIKESSSYHYQYQPQFVKIEEHNFFGEESCSTFFSDDQAPTLQWYCNDQWN